MILAGSGWKLEKMGSMHLYYMPRFEQDQVRMDGQTLVMLDYLITCTK